MLWFPPQWLAANVNCRDNRVASNHRRQIKLAVSASSHGVRGHSYQHLVETPTQPGIEHQIVMEGPKHQDCKYN